MSTMNIKLIIGDNSVGKTRYLKKLISEYKDNGYDVVTNIDKYAKNVLPDRKKIELIVKDGNPLFERIIVNREIKNTYEVNLEVLFKLICAKGNVLVMDELEAGLYDTDMMWVIIAVSQVRKLWEEIWVTGFDSALMRLFVDVDEDGHEEVNNNVYKVEKDYRIVEISEEEADEYFDTV